VLPFLERTTFFLYPIGVVIVLSPICKFLNTISDLTFVSGCFVNQPLSSFNFAVILSGFNPSRYFMNVYFSQRVWFTKLTLRMAHIWDGGNSSETTSTMRWPNFFHIHVVKLRGGLQNENLCSFIVVFFPFQVEIKPIQVGQARSVFYSQYHCSSGCVFHGLLFEKVNMIIPCLFGNCMHLLHSKNRSRVSAMLSSKWIQYCKHQFFWCWYSWWMLLWLVATIVFTFKPVALCH